MKKFFSSLNNFLKFIADNKVWAFASSVFVFFFWFTINFYSTAPNEWIEINQRRLALDKIKLEGDVIDSIYGHVLTALEKSQAAHDAYGKFVQQTKDEQKIPKREDLLNYYIELNSINNDISREIANLDSLKSNNPEIDGYAKEFSSDLKTYQTLFDKMENVLQSLLKEESQEQTLDSILAQVQALMEQPIYLEKTMNRMTGFSAAVDKILQDDTAALATLENDTKLFFRKTYIGIFGFAYMLGFIFIAMRKWYYYNKSKRRSRNNRKKA